MTNTASQGFNPARSQVCQTEMMNWLRSPITGDLTEVPGIGPVNAKHLKDGSVASPVTTTHQLIGTYLQLRSEGVDQQEHHQKMWEYLQSKGLNSHRSGIVDAIASKCNVWMPGSYRPEEFAAPVKPLEETVNNENNAPVNENSAPVNEQQEAPVMSS